MSTFDLPKTSPGGNTPLSLLHNYLHNTPQQQLPTWGTTLRLWQPQACSTSTWQAQGMRPCHSYVRVRSDKDTSERVRSAQHTGKHKWFYFTPLRAWPKHKLELSCGSHGLIFSKLHVLTSFKHQSSCLVSKDCITNPISEKKPYLAPEATDPRDRSLLSGKAPVCF